MQLVFRALYDEDGGGDTAENSHAERVFVCNLRGFLRQTVLSLQNGRSGMFYNFRDPWDPFDTFLSSRCLGGYIEIGG